MQSKSKILVLKMRELVYTGIFLFLAVVLIVLLVLMFRTEKAPEKRTSISTERYTAGVYSSPVTLGDTVVDVTVTVDPDRIKAIDLNNLSETTSTMYPLIRPAVEELEAQILEKQSTKDITWEETGRWAFFREPRSQGKRQSRRYGSRRRRRSSCRNPDRQGSCSSPRCRVPESSWLLPC